MAQAASQLHQIQKNQQSQIGGSGGIGGNILSRIMPSMNSRQDPFHSERPQPTKAQLTMPPSLQHNKMNAHSGSDPEKPRTSLGGSMPGNSPISLSPLGPLGGPPSHLFGGLSELSPTGCHVPV